MASLIRENHNGKVRYRIQFYDKDGARKSIRLTRVNERYAQRIADRVDDLVAASIAGATLDVELAAFVGKLGDELRTKLAAAGLVPQRQTTTLATFLDAYIDGRSDAQPNTLRNFKNTRNRLVLFFGADRDLRTITAGDAHDWRQSMVTAGGADATISKAVKQAKQFFKYALVKRWMETNPLDGLKGGSERNESRLQFIDRTTIQKVIDAAPDAEWRLIIALSRYGGLRCPSETLSLKWTDIRWDANRMIVASPKTAKTGKAFREVPIYPELRTYLDDAHTVAPDGAVYAIGRYRDTKDQNLRTQFLRIMRKAGVAPWERLFHNLRASRQTELCNQFPAHVVAQWQGNSVRIAEQHYLTTLDSHFDQAVATGTAAGGTEGAKGGATGGAMVAQKVVRQGIAPVRLDSLVQQKTPVITGALPTLATSNELFHSYEILPTGFEPVLPD